MAQMTKREKNAEKNKRLHQREEKREKLTNWYMINFCYGILAIVVLVVFRQLYKTSSVVPYMQMTTWILTAVFAIAAGLIFLLGRNGKIKNTSRANNYAIFLGVCALGALWLSLYNRIRPVMETVLVKITGNNMLSVNSHWNVVLLIYGVIIYIVAAFIYYVVKLNKID